MTFSILLNSIQVIGDADLPPTPRKRHAATVLSPSKHRKPFDFKQGLGLSMPSGSGSSSSAIEIDAVVPVQSGSGAERGSKVSSSGASVTTRSSSSKISK